MKRIMELDFKEILTVSMVLFAVIDIVGSVPMLISLKEKMGGINVGKVTLICGALMVLFFFLQYSGKNLSSKPAEVQALVINTFYFSATQV